SQRCERRRSASPRWWPTGRLSEPPVNRPPQVPWLTAVSHSLLIVNLPARQPSDRRFHDTPNVHAWYSEYIRVSLQHRRLRRCGALTCCNTSTKAVSTSSDLSLRSY